MNNTIYYDAAISDDLRRKLLFEGQLFVYSPVSSSIAFIEFAKSMIEDAFGGRDPRGAQDNMAVEDYAALLAKLKPEFIHHPESKRHLQNIFEEIGVDRTKTYFDVPRMRTRQVTATSQPASPMLGTLTETPGIRPRPVRSIGGFRYTRSSQITRWHSTRVTGTSRSRIAPRI